MELNNISEPARKTFFNHVFSATEEGKAEIFNVVQYSLMGVIPVVLLNKLIQRFVPEADSEKSALELLAEIFLQLIVMFCGIILIHRMITYFPTYSGFKYENLSLTNVILAFLIIVLSIQTKLGIKVNILVDRINELWSGSNTSDAKERNGVRISQPQNSHSPSQADFLDSTGMQSGTFPPAPVASGKQQNTGYDMMMRGSPAAQMDSYMGPMAANGVLGGSFGSSF